MFKIKLLILLLSNLFLYACIKNELNYQNKFSLAYIGGEYDGLLLKNLLSTNLHSFGLLDESSNYEIVSNISHSTNIFITNIDNTSDREKVSTNLTVEIINNNLECSIKKMTFDTSQFYIYATSDKFISNQSAVKKIKRENTETLVKQFINELRYLNLRCNE